MNEFRSAFLVNTDLESVSAFHHDTSALKKLSPPPMFVQLHHVEPLAENSIAEFTLWFGPIPMRWKAKHEQVTTNGFTDIQVEGPMSFWKHKHIFEKKGERQVLVRDTVYYLFPRGLRGLFLRLLFNKAGLNFLFSYRAWATRRNVKNN